MRTTLDLPDELFRKIKAEAAMRGETLKQYLQRLIESGHAEQSTGSRKAQKGLDAFVKRAQKNSMPLEVSKLRREDLYDRV
jgi:hypothetical protein